MNDISVLVVDDDEDVRVALCDELSRDYAVSTARNGQEAFSALSARRFDVVISDLKMPDHDGIEVLDFAHEQDAEVIRVLLTGYVDERAHRALLRAGAPYKVGKPWHDEIEIVLRRALEQRRRTRRLASSVTAAISLRQVEAALDAAAGLSDLGELLALQAASFTGVTSVCVELEGEPLVGQVPASPERAPWCERALIASERELVLTVLGEGDETRELVRYLAHLGQRRAGMLVALGARARDAVAPTSRFAGLMRHAATGVMTSALLHDLASSIQVLDSVTEEVVALADARGDRELHDACGEMAAVSGTLVSTFVAMRRFIRDGEPVAQATTARKIIDRVLRQAGGRVRSRTELRLAPIPDLAVSTGEPMLAQALIHLLDNAAAASPPGGAVDLEVRTTAAGIAFVVTDDGPGVDEALVPLLFDPWVWHRPLGVGNGLAIAADLVSALGGTLAYQRADRRGACFTITVPRTRSKPRTSPPAR